MAEEIAVESSRISNAEGLVTLILTLDRVILHTVVHQSSTSTCMPNFIEIEETFCERTDGHLRPTLLGQLEEVDLIMAREMCSRIDMQIHGGRM